MRFAHLGESALQNSTLPHVKTTLNGKMLTESTKIKDIFDEKYLIKLSEKIHDVHKNFRTTQLVALWDEIKDKTFSQRIDIIARGIGNAMPHYAETLELLKKLLVPIDDFAVIYSKGIKFAPFGRYVEIYAPQHPDNFNETVQFVEKFTMCYTGEFAMRPVIEAFPIESMEVLKLWSVSENVFVRRLASECMRVNLPWARKLTAAVKQWKDYVDVLDNLVCDGNPYVTRSVANNLNELYKYDNALAVELTKHWQEKFGTKADAVIKHGTRWARRYNLPCCR